MSADPLSADSLSATTDVIVVGGGTAGCVVAGRLAEAGKHVLLIEAGPDYGAADPSWPADLLAASALPTSHDWGYTGPGAGGQPLSLDRARVIGGCSSHNGCTQSAGWAGDYDGWAAAGGLGWSSAALGPHFAKAVHTMRIRPFAKDEVQPFHRAFLGACACAGLPLADDFLDLAAGVGAGCPPVNIEAGVRFNAAFAYLDPVREAGFLTVIADTTVDRVLVREGLAVGVEVLQKGERRTLVADQVVLAAGAYGSPAILQRSGIGDATTLATAGVALVHELPGVGQNLHDHPAIQLEFEGTEALARKLEEFARTRWLPEEQSVARLRSPESLGPYDLHVYPWVEPVDDAQTLGAQAAWKCVIPVGLLTPRSRGTVTITSTDPAAAPNIHTGFFSDEEGSDLRAVRWGVRWVLALLRDPSLAESLGEMTSGPPRNLAQDPTDDQIDSWVIASHAHYWHPAGSCRMGSAATSGAVVDFAGRVHGLAGLWVSDASVFPAIPRATPALPTVVVGERIARFLLGGS